MNLAEQLKQAQKQKVIDYANEFARAKMETISESAKQGWGGFKWDIENIPNKHLVTDSLFIETLKEFYTGCEVEIKTTEHIAFLTNQEFTKRWLVIRWDARSVTK